jgi:hypothetical protein
MTSRRYVIGPLGYGLSLVLAFVSPWTSLGLHALLAALLALPERKALPVNQPGPLRPRRESRRTPTDAWP